MKTIFNGKNLRAGRHSLKGQPYLVTAVTCSDNKMPRREIFSNLYHARALVAAFQQSEKDGHRILAYVVMPDHFHWLLQLGEVSTLSSVVQKVKSLTTKRLYSKALELPGAPVWQKGFHDHAIRSDEDIRRSAQYIIMNPVRAGLCSSPKHYSHWDCVWIGPREVF